MRLDGLSVYLSGPMTGIDEWNAPAFHAARKACRAAGAAYVYDPCDHGVNDYDPNRMTHEEAMALSARVLLDPGPYQVAVTRPGRVPHSKFDAVVLLPGGEDSSGVAFELAIAEACGIPVVSLADVDATIAA